MSDENKKPQIDPTIKEALAAILVKEPRELREDEKAFLRARKAYVDKKAQRKFAEALGEEPEKTVTPKRLENTNNHPGDFVTVLPGFSETKHICDKCGVKLLANDKKQWYCPNMRCVNNEQYEELKNIDEEEDEVEEDDEVEEEKG